MIVVMGDGLTLNLPPDMDLRDMEKKNYSSLFSDVQVTAEADPDYEQFLADVWVGVVLTLMVLSCVCCMCSCLLYHKFQQWKRSVIEARNHADLEAGTLETDLPSYTIASGLPTYQEALEQLKKVKENSPKNSDSAAPNDCPRPLAASALAPLSVVSLLQIYKTSETAGKPVTN